MRAIKGLLSGVGHVLARPILVWEAYRTALAMRRHGRLGPSGSYLRWRISTAYGVADHAVERDDLIAFLAWRRVMRAIADPIEAR